MAKFNTTFLDPEFAFRDTIASKAKFANADTVIQGMRGLLFRELDEEVDTSKLKSMFGTPVFDTVEFQSGIDSDGTSYDGLRIDTALITINQSKNIVTTPIQGRNGTIKEYIADGDYVISITGLIIGESTEISDGFVSESTGNKYPEKDITSIKNICKLGETITINSMFLNRFDIDDVVITGYKFDQRAGQYNSQMFEINLLSDNLEELVFGTESIQ